ncbi:MAG TPA: hypothetical protein EYP78_05755 [Candidatus Omnitrophica bacterium]|nr:hypothetical protein [Candidatus Omnitrophota bacterium]
MGEQRTFDFEKKEVSITRDIRSTQHASGERIALSPSTLNIFRDCPRCFWQHMNLRIQRPRGAFPSIASGLDDVIKNYFESYREKGILPPFLKGKIDGRLIPRLPKKLFYNDRLRNVLLWGMLDECLLLSNSVYAALDFKTRRSFPQDIHPSYQLQMDVYTLLLEKNNYKTNGISYLLYFVPTYGQLHEGIPFDIQIVEVKTSIQRALEIFHRAIEVLKGPIPGPLENCEYCSWLKEIKRNSDW